MGNVSEGNAVIKRLDGKDKGGRKLRLMRLAQKMIVGGALLLDRVANSHLHHLAALVSEQLFPAFVNEVCRFFSRRPSFCELHQGSSRSQLIAFLLSSAASRILVELPCSVRWQGFEGEVFGGRTGDQFEPGARLLLPTASHPRQQSDLDARRLGVPLGF